MLQVQDERLIRVAREKDKILDLFRSRGMRVTKQRKLILDIVFEQDCTSCKEIYYQASKRDKNIGIATVYRMVNALSELGVFQTNVPYRLTAYPAPKCGNGCRVILKNQCEVDFDAEEWQRVLVYALNQKGYTGEPEIDRVILK
ncbi:MAG: transcriptional repressor [Eubacteriales bacterium]|nr:transcriptional repressor [Eubacteriales bacterium]